MLCSSCKKNQLLLRFEEYIVSKNPTEYQEFDNIFKNYSIIATEDMICTECGCKIVKGESYIKREDCVFDIVFQYLAEQIMDEIECCEQCGDGEDIQGLYPSIKSCFYDEDDDPEAIFDSFNTASTIEEIMGDVFWDRWDLWEEYFEDIVGFVRCPNCNNGSGIDYDDKINYGTFDLYTQVYTKGDIDRFNHDFYGDEIEFIQKEISDLAKKFSLDELVALKNKYIQNRIYVACNPVFEKLERFIENLYKQMKWYILSKNRIIFRTRTASIGKLLAKEELWEPPYGVSSHGRYNGIGASVLYCANNKDVIKKEIALPSGYNYNIAKFILHKDMHLFPINNVFSGEFNGLISEAVPLQQQNINFKQQYIIGNIVSAICLKTGYDGIVYRSTKDNVSINYALFDKYEKGKDIDILSVDV
ncbi:MAG: RES family NAD+ phosphorylase [Roseburia sp.]|nr:RES family NAD+ phosphorylase [Roseburia sp.]